MWSLDANLTAVSKRQILTAVFIWKKWLMRERHLLFQKDFRFLPQYWLKYAQIHHWHTWDSGPHMLTSLLALWLYPGGSWDRRLACCVYRFHRSRHWRPSHRCSQTNSWCRSIDRPRTWADRSARFLRQHSSLCALLHRYPMHLRSSWLPLAWVAGQLLFLARHSRFHSSWLGDYGGGGPW